MSQLSKVRDFLASVSFENRLTEMACWAFALKGGNICQESVEYLFSRTEDKARSGAFFLLALSSEKDLKARPPEILEALESLGMELEMEFPFYEGDPVVWAVFDPGDAVHCEGGCDMPLLARVEDREPANIEITDFCRERTEK